jgi:hypothetical protein
MRKVLSLAFFVLFAPLSAFAMNDVCQKEIAPLMESHNAAMAGGKNLPKGKPKTYEQALNNANAHCGFMSRLSTSFNKLNAWMEKNKDFCQVSPNDVNAVKGSLATVVKNRDASCNAVSQLKQQKSQAERQQALAIAQQRAPGQNPFASPATKGRENDPFNPVIQRKPQLSL